VDGLDGAPAVGGKDSSEPYDVSASGAAADDDADFDDAVDLDEDFDDDDADGDGDSVSLSSDVDDDADAVTVTSGEQGEELGFDDDEINSLFGDVAVSTDAAVEASGMSPGDSG